MSRSTFARLGFCLVVIAGAAAAQMPNPPEFPDENQPLPDQSTLGKFLFWEEQVSSDNSMSCGTCHIHEAGGSDPRASVINFPHPGFDGVFGTVDDVAGSPGVVRHDVSGVFIHEDDFFPDIQRTGRKSPSAINALFAPDIFWDGRALSEFTDPMSGLVEIVALGGLESQAAGPPTSDVEMAGVGQTWPNIVAKLANVRPGALMSNIPADMAPFLAANPTYPDMFTAVYGDSTITSKRVLFAIANYERTLISDETLMDDLLKGDIVALPPALEPGRLVFQGTANCQTCHVLPFAADHNFHNIGVRPDAEDLGRFNVTADPADTGKFKTPNLRGANERFPLFHNGSKNSMTEIVDFYDAGGDFDDGNLDEEIFPLNLTAQERDDLIAFMEGAWTDQRVVDNTFPFTRPTLFSELTSLNSEYGVESLNGVGVPPVMIGHVPANRGHPLFMVGVDEATASSAAVVAMAFEPDPAGTPFPDPRFPVPVNLDLDSIFLVEPLVTDAFGVATYAMAIPKSGALIGLHFYVQIFIEDEDAMDTGGVYGTKGLDVEVF